MKRRKTVFSLTHKPSSRLIRRDSLVSSGSTTEKYSRIEGKDEGIAFVAADEPGCGVSWVARAVRTGATAQKYEYSRSTDGSNAVNHSERTKISQTYIARQNLSSNLFQEATCQAGYGIPLSTARSPGRLIVSRRMA
jgi:hypothetical protein